MPRQDGDHFVRRSTSPFGTRQVTHRRSVGRDDHVAHFEERIRWVDWFRFGDVKPGTEDLPRL
jgi:hypothetical protein